MSAVLANVARRPLRLEGRAEPCDCLGEEHSRQRKWLETENKGKSSRKVRERVESRLCRSLEATIRNMAFSLH